MSDFDDLDLGRRLRAAAGDEPDVPGAREALQRRVRRARQRRAIGTSAAAALVLLSAGTVAAIATRGDSDRLETAASDPTAVVSTTSVITTEPSTSSTVATSDSTTSFPTTVAGSSTLPGTTPSTAPHNAPVQPPSTSTTVTSPGAVSTTSVPTTTSTPTSTTTPTTTPPAPVQNTYSSFGGSITVRLANGSLSLVGSPSPAAGYTAQIEKQEAAEIEVRFEAGEAHSTIRVRLVGDQMVRDDPGDDDSGTGSGDDGATDDH